MPHRRVLLVQLPIPQPGMAPARGNVPLAGGYLALYARHRGLDQDYDIQILPSAVANTRSDLGLIEEILAAEPWLVGFTCYLWNIDRTLWVAERLKARRPDLQIILGGPEITLDNAWVLAHPAVDYASIGEGEQTFSELLLALRTSGKITEPINGLYLPPARRPSGWPTLPGFRKPLPHLNDVSSPYLAGILDAAEERMLFLETLRGCVFQCKFCYYPKSYDDIYFLSKEKLIANLQHAHERDVEEIVLLDPTLNQRKDFAGFVKLLGECNPDRKFQYFGELRAEGITPEIARLLREANFTEVEIGLQSVDPLAQELMDRKNNLKAFEKGVRALRGAGIRVKVDMIIGLPGDTVDSIRRGMDYLRDSDLYDNAQVFNLAILPGTAFRMEAQDLGLTFQSRPPYYVLETPTLGLADFYQLMQEAEETFDTEFDPFPAPEIPSSPGSRDETGLFRSVRIDLEARRGDSPAELLPAATERGQAFTLWLRAGDFRPHRETANRLVAKLLEENPHSTLQIILEPAHGLAGISLSLLDELRRTALLDPSYLDRFYAILPGPPKGAKRLLVLLTDEMLDGADEDLLEQLRELATIAVQTSTPARSASEGFVSSLAIDART